MKQIALFFTLVFPIALLTQCSTIPPRPLAEHEQSLVGIWMVNQSVTGVGRMKGVQQFLPNRSFNILVNTVRGTSQANAQWEAINGQLHVTSFGKPEAWDGYRFSSDGNTLYIRGDSGDETEWQRYSHSPYHPLQSAFAEVPDHGWGRVGVSGLADLMHGAMSADVAIHKQRAAVGDADSIRWLEEHEDRIHAMGSSLDQSHEDALARERGRFPID